MSAVDGAVVVAFYTVALLVVLGFPHGMIGYPLDDSWIHQVVSRNFADDGTLGFIPHVRSSGSSSLLWSLLLAVRWKFLSGVNPVIYTAVLGWICLVATGLTLLRMALEDGWPRTTCWLWALTPALQGNFVWLGVVGMEHLLFATLSILAIYLWFLRGAGSATACAVCLGLLALTRPEGIALTLFLLVTARLARRSTRDSGIVGVVVAVCVGISLAANYITSRSLLPTTFTGRKWLYFGTDHVPLMARVIFPYVLFRRLLQPWAIVQTHPLYVFNVIMALLIAAGAWRVWRERRLRTGFLTLWMVAMVLIYTALLPSPSHGGRYQPLMLGMIFPLMFVGLEGLLIRAEGAGARSHAALRTACVAVLCVLCGVSSLRAWRIVTADGVALVESTHAPMGRWLVANLPPGAKVAAFDIGRIGTIYGGSLVDMGGLTDTSFLTYLKERRTFDYLAERNISYLVWPVSAKGGFQVGQVVDFTPEMRSHMHEVTRFCAPYAIWKVSYDAIDNAAECQVLFHLDFSQASPAKPEAGK